MCDVHLHELEPLEHDEYVLDTPRVCDFVARVQELRSTAAGARETCDAVRPLFEQLLEDREWLPEEFQLDAPTSGMGGGIGQWLLYRAADRSLCLFSLVVPSGAKTPIHDHLAWGLIGLYRGNQDEEFYRPGEGTLELVRRRPLEPGDLYALLPPENDIHCVRTTSDVTSVSIHLLANDTGCVLRHTYDEHTGASSPFRSGYVNAPCPEGTEAGKALAAP
jgi:predicted metal-dependent enzyme (double-stranded beta helix superfamily)